MPATNYAQLAEIYDLLVISDEDIAFFIQEATKTSGEVVELMCGTGRVSIPVAAAGVKLTCVDNSDEMLSILRQKLRGHDLSIRIELQDIAALNLQDSYDLAFIPYNSFHEIVEKDQQKEALARIYSLLNSQGKFICTLHNPKVRLQTVGGRFVLEMPVAALGEGCKAKATIETTYRAERSIVEGIQEFEILDSNGSSMKHLHLPLRFALFEKDEFQKLVEGQGFAVEAVYGDYQRAEYDPEQSRSMIWMLRKEHG